MTAWAVSDIPDQSDRTAVVTGANSGLGLETARELARAGAAVVLTVRDLDKGERAIADIRRDQPDANLSLLQLDLASLESVARAASELHDRIDRIDLLINNAGVMYTPKGTTADGHELQVGTNHLGHFAWTARTIDLVRDVAGARVVTVASVAHRIMSTIDPADPLGQRGRYHRVAAYGRSKLANLLFTYELQRRLESAQAPAQALAAHPGVSSTELGRHLPGSKLFMPMVRPVTQSPAAGALPTLRAATDLGATGGQYFGPDGFMEWRGDPVVVESSDASHDRSLQARLWEASVDASGVDIEF